MPYGVFRPEPRQGYATPRQAPELGLLTQSTQPQTITMQSATLASAAAQATVTPGAVSPPMSAGALVGTGRNLTIVPGAATATMGTGQLSITSQVLTIVPDALSLAIDASL